MIILVVALALGSPVDQETRAAETLCMDSLYAYRDFSADMRIKIDLYRFLDECVPAVMETK